MLCYSELLKCALHIDELGDQELLRPLSKQQLHKKKNEDILNGVNLVRNRKTAKTSEGTVVILCMYYLDSLVRK